MESRISISKQLDVLYQTGADLSQEFAEEQFALQKQEKERQAEEGDEGEEEGKPHEDEQEVEARARKAAEFDLKYQRWYSIALALMKQLAPDRLAEFQAYYQPQPKRDEVDGTNYTIQDWFRYRGFDAEVSSRPWTVVVQCFLNQLTILRSVKDRLEWQALATEDHLERALQLDLLDAARDLIGIDERAAGVLAGTVLEAYLKKFAAKHEVKLRKQSPPTAELVEALKQAKVFDVPVWSQATWLAEVHGRCLKKGEGPTKLQVRDLVDGTQWLLTHVF